MDLFSLKSQTALLTGAARGLGLAFAEALVSAGCNIAVLDIVLEPSPDLFNLRARYSVKVGYYRTDIASREQVTQTVSQVKKEFGSIDINVHAAGVATDEPFLSTLDKNLSATFAVNFTGSFLVAQACVDSMVRRYQSAHGTTPAQNPTTVQQISCYTASKTAVKGLVKPLAIELAPYGIRVNSSSPGYLMTDMMRHQASTQHAEQRANPDTLLTAELVTNPP